MIDEWGKGAKYWDHAWNPVIGCEPVSEGCENCYAKAMWKRFHPESDFNPTWTKKAAPRKGVVFVGNMTDLFGSWNTDRSIYTWLDELSPAATNLILTKRAERMNMWLPRYLCQNFFWFGVTAENQERADERIPQLLKCNAQKRWLSLEPLLGQIDLGKVWSGDYFCPRCRNHFDEAPLWLTPCCGVECSGNDDYNCPECGQEFSADEEIPQCPVCGNDGGGRWRQPSFRDCFYPDERLGNINWVVVGAESGANARPCKIEWIESIVDQCQAANVPVFVKQIHLNGKLVTDINLFPPHLRIRQVPWSSLQLSPK